MSSTKPLLAFYGATGGSTLAALVPALKAGYDCTALIRTPSKLTTLLEKNVPQSAIDAHLHITQGDVLSVDAVKGPLIFNGRTADIIFCGVGVRVFMQRSPEVTICTDAIMNIFTALRELKPSVKPLFVALTSTGLTRPGEPRDLPWLMMPLYHYALANPHADKMRMEKAIEEEAARGKEAVIKGFVMPRPSLLTDGKALGAEKVRVGDERKPAVGYTISRDDVGGWMFENLIEGAAERWVGKKVTLTY